MQLSMAPKSSEQALGWLPLNFRLGIDKSTEFSCPLQVRSLSGHLEVNVDPLLIEVLSEIHYLTRPPLSVRLPVSFRQLVKAIDFKQLKHRKTSLEVS